MVHVTRYYMCQSSVELIALAKNELVMLIEVGLPQHFAEVLALIAA